MKKSVKITFSTLISIIVALLLLYYSPVNVTDYRPLESLVYKACPLVAFAVGYLVYQVTGLLEH
ncbi:hypothetical protein [Shewanella surugensis]|uniref:Uncharacterized protein n=1 Tax=Shewanella surugensis TaxID=212020 RepID=A0ABT0LGS4_9GAMM|nr:hypothetical protein [Shewanella surugensis]MCL1126893.1 hypothetical protein [Shewanella surugensis]